MSKRIANRATSVVAPSVSEVLVEAQLAAPAVPMSDPAPCHAPLSETPCSSGKEDYLNPATIENADSHEQYDDLRSELEYLQARFEEQGKKSPDLGHQVCRYIDDHGHEERLSESAWAAFIRHNSYLPDGKWQEWHVLNDGRWCGRFFGTGSLKMGFESLAAQVILVLERLTKVSGAGDYFFINLPPDRGYDAWLRLLYGAGELCDQPKTESELWGVPEGQQLPFLASRTYWSRPDANGVSYPLHPECMSLANDVFSASAKTLEFLLHDLVQGIPLSEHRDFLLPYEDNGICVPPYLPANPWEDATILRELIEGFQQLASPAPDTVDQTSGEHSVRPVWDGVARLCVGDRVVKDFTQYASNQFVVLDWLDDAGWPNPCKVNPFKDHLGKPIRELLSQTLCDLNKDQKEVRIHFWSRSGAVYWQIMEAPASPD